jgi:hypothetical protein
MHQQETTVTTKEALHRLVDELPDEELPEAERMLRALTIVDPVERSLALAPVEEEEPLSDEDLTALAEARAEAARGETLSTDELRRELGL